MTWWRYNNNKLLLLQLRADNACSEMRSDIGRATVAKEKRGMTYYLNEVLCNDNKNSIALNV